MTCKDAEKLIPLFLDDDLDNKDLSDFLHHVDTCPECREELTIQFLVQVGMKRLEDGKNFNLNKELTVLLGDAKKRLTARRYLVLLSYVLEAAVVVMFGACIVLALAL